MGGRKCILLTHENISRLHIPPYFRKRTSQAFYYTTCDSLRRRRQRMRGTVEPHLKWTLRHAARNLLRTPRQYSHYLEYGMRCCGAVGHGPWWVTFSRDEILFPRLHPRAAAGFLNWACYIELPTWRGECRGGQDAPETKEKMHCCKYTSLGWCYKYLEFIMIHVLCTYSASTPK